MGWYDEMDVYKVVSDYLKQNEQQMYSYSEVRLITKAVEWWLSSFDVCDDDAENYFYSTLPEVIQEGISNIERSVV